MIKGALVERVKWWVMLWASSIKPSPVSLRSRQLWIYMSTSDSLGYRFFLPGRKEKETSSVRQAFS